MGRFEDYRTYRTALGGRLLEVEIGKLAEQANGQATVRYGDTVVSCTVCASKEPKQDVDFFPLTCNFEEKLMLSVRSRADTSREKDVRARRPR